VPEIAGGAVLVGAIAALLVTIDVGAERAVLEPAGFEAVTATLSVEPTSAATAV
jgi:hypothetical protein